MHEMAVTRSLLALVLGEAARVGVRHPKIREQGGQMIELDNGNLVIYTG